MAQDPPEALSESETSLPIPKYMGGGHPEPHSVRTAHSKKRDESIGPSHGDGFFPECGHKLGT